jgi:hypothetical protein
VNRLIVNKPDKHARRVQVCDVRDAFLVALRTCSNCPSAKYRWVQRVFRLSGDMIGTSAFGAGYEMQNRDRHAAHAALCLWRRIEQFPNGSTAAATTTAPTATRADVGSAISRLGRVAVRNRL